MLKLYYRMSWRRDAWIWGPIHAHRFNYLQPAFAEGSDSTHEPMDIYRDRTFARCGPRNTYCHGPVTQIQYSKRAHSAPHVWPACCWRPFVCYSTCISHFFLPVHLARPVSYSRCCHNVLGNYLWVAGYFFVFFFRFFFHFLSLNSDPKQHSQP